VLFRVVYRFENERLLEIHNRTVHAALAERGRPGCPRPPARRGPPFTGGAGSASASTPGRMPPKWRVAPAATTACATGPAAQSTALRAV
jgi:hypothetical protein